ncbi:hypothetical protein V8C86DRAFT_1052312 [Haematococcus lacustris]
MEEVDVAIVGGGVAGLAAAVALNQVQPDLRIKVMESRPSPLGKYGGFVKLQPNGLKAAAAISPALAAAMTAQSLPEKKTLLHGDDGRLIMRLDTRLELAPAPSGPLDELCGRGEAVSATRNADEHSQSRIIGWSELERLLIEQLPEHTVEYEASFLKYHESEGGVVAIFEGLAYPLRSQVLLGCDGPFSGVRAHCVQDSEPAYDRTVKWVGRLDGHHVSTTPLDFEALWVKKGQVFVSHPLINGDVGWEAVVGDRELQAAGFSYDEGLGRVLPVGAAREVKEGGGLPDMAPSQALLEVFKGWPRAVEQMIRSAPLEAVLEGGVYIRSASDLPPSMGKGRVAIMGEAAHPLRPTGQDSNIALEDAAELAAFVQEYGLTKEALRRYDVARRPRWRHVMQLTWAQGASTATGSALSQGFIDYTQDLFRRDFRPLHPPGASPAAALAKLGSAVKAGAAAGAAKVGASSSAAATSGSGAEAGEAGAARPGRRGRIALALRLALRAGGSGQGGGDRCGGGSSKEAGQQALHQGG